MSHLCRTVASAILLVSMGVLSAPAHAARPATSSDRLVIRGGYGSPVSSITVRGGHGHSLHLPPGLYSPRSHRLFVTTPSANTTQTRLSVISADTGRSVQGLTLQGSFSTATGDYSVATLSFNGLWLALRSLSSVGQSTEVAIVSTPHLRLVARFHLAGQFGLDAIDGHGRVLYLTESLPAQGPQAYDVRSYNLATNVLDPSPLIEKGETVGTMNGVAQTRAWSSDGSWLFTLYVRPGGAGAFIHSLDVQNRIAHCIFLPDKNVAVDVLARYALAVGRGGNALYAVNPTLGRVFAVERGTQVPLAYGNTGSTSLPVQADSIAHAMHGAVVSRYGHTLFVATQRGIWVIGTTKLSLRSTYVPGRSVVSVVLSQDGQRLYALEPGRNKVEILSASHGTRLGHIAIARGSWAIEQVMH